MILYTAQTRNFISYQYALRVLYLILQVFDGIFNSLLHFVVFHYLTSASQTISKELSKKKRSNCLLDVYYNSKFSIILHLVGMN